MEPLTQPPRPLESLDTGDFTDPEVILSGKVFAKASNVTQNRLTVVQQVYCQVAESEPVAYESKFSVLLPEDVEDPYERRLKVGPEWRPLDIGGLENLSQLVITNLASLNTQTNPTKEEKEILSKQILEIGMKEETMGRPLGPIQPFVLVPPSESFRGLPIHPQKLLIRCQEGTVRYHVVAIAR